MDSKNKFVKAEYLSIGLDVIVYDAKYSRSYGTVGQLVRSLQDMSKRSDEKGLEKVDDAYHAELHPQIVKQCNEIVEFYEKYVSSIPLEEYSIFGYYLNGSLNNGKRRQTTNKNEKKRYEISKINETLRSIDDRLRHIKYDCIRKKRNEQSSESSVVLENVILFSNLYHKEIRTQLTTWYNFVKDIREKHNFQQPVNDNIRIKAEDTLDQPSKFLIRKKTYQELENTSTRLSS